MQISVILAHPQPGSFNHAIAREADNALQVNGHTVEKELAGNGQTGYG
ncbi:MAG: hypothetical protein ABRQ31_10415 [Smithellaceae bacterium]|jgi:putative NADPH-quinone reductase